MSIWSDSIAAHLERARELLRHEEQTFERVKSASCHLRAALVCMQAADEESPADPWELPTDLAWHRGQDGTWWIIDPNSDDTLRLVNGCHRGPLLDRPDADHLADLLHRRNAAEPRRPRDWDTALAVLGHWRWAPPTRLHGWWAVPTNPHSAFDVVPLREVTTLWAERAREVHPEVAKLVDERDAVERGR